MALSRVWIACLSVALSLVFPAAADAADRRVALVISNADYKNTPPLLNPPRDADAVASKLKAMNFDDVEIVRDATAEQMRKKLRDFALKSRLADVSLIYYAGHGLEAEGQNYFVPVDARLETDLDIAYEAVGLDLAVRAVSGAKKLKLLVLDACRDNPLIASMKFDGNKAKSYAVGLAPIESIGDVLVSYAAEAGKVAEDGTQGENSPFAKALVDHIAVPGVDVRQMLGRVRDSVLKSTGDRQRPFIYASLGGEPIYLVPPVDAVVAAKTSPVVIDLQMADPKDEAVHAALGDDAQYFGFTYDLKNVGKKDQTATLTPNLKYFTSATGRDRPFIQAVRYGYFVPEESSGWAVAYPLVDIIARRSEPRVITLSRLIVEVDKSTPDSAPYTGIASPSDEFARLTLFNEGWSEVKRATLEYDVLGFDKPADDKVQALLKAKRDGGYAHKASIGPFQDFASISLAEGLAKAVPNFANYRYNFIRGSSSQAQTADQKKQTAPPPGYAAWLKANPKISKPDERGEGVWIAGRMIVESAREGTPPVIVDFQASVAMYPPEGLGGGNISYTLKNMIEIKSEGAAYDVKRNIGFLLDEDTKTFRGLYGLLVDRTSRHRLRFRLQGDGGQDLYVSDWIDAHIVVPRYSSRQAAWVKSGAKGRPPLKGVKGP